jgi:hypothetical protein
VLHALKARRYLLEVVVRPANRRQRHGFKLDGAPSLG